MIRILRIFESRILLIGTVLIGAVWGFLALADEVDEGGTMGVDRRLLLMFRVPGDSQQPIGSQSFQDAMRDVTALGGVVFLTLLTVVAALAFLLHRKRIHALVLVAAVLVA